jgi:hypothetical protein
MKKNRKSWRTLRIIGLQPQIHHPSYNISAEKMAKRLKTYKYIFAILLGNKRKSELNLSLHRNQI